MNYCYGKRAKKCVLCWAVVPFSEGPLSEVPLYSTGSGGMVGPQIVLCSDVPLQSV